MTMEEKTNTVTARKPLPNSFNFYTPCNMNRIKIDVPETFLFATTLQIRVTDLNYGGHVGNDSFLSLLQEARQQFLLSHGYRELSIAGVGLIMADVAIEFKKN